MRQWAIGFLVVALAFTLSCDNKKKKWFPFWGDESTSEVTTGTEGTNDKVNDEKSSEEFNFQTVHNVTFDIQVYDENNTPLSKAAVRLASEEGDITTSITADNGTTEFKVSLSTAITAVSLIVEHQDCVTRIVEIENIQELASVNRTIFLELQPDKKPKPDSDGDGVADDTDEFPNDPNLIATQTGEYTIAFEDLWPAKGDADFNDMVVRLTLKEYINNNNMVSKVVVSAKLLAAGAGYKNQLWINILGKDYELISNPKKDLNGKWNSRPGDKYVEGPTHTKEIVFDSPVPQDAMDPMPYDPYIKCNGNDKNQVHLSFVKSKFEGKRLDVDGFPWALLVPSDWAWPYEGSNIFQAYPEFKTWYESDGKESADWYTRPDLAKVYKVSAGTALTAYLTRISGAVHPGVAVAVLGGMIVLIVGINLLKRRSAHS